MTKRSQVRKTSKILIICAIIFVVTSSAAQVNAAPLQTKIDGIHRNIDGLDSVFEFTNNGDSQESFTLAFYWPDGTHLFTDTGHVLDPGQQKTINLKFYPLSEPYFYGYVIVSGYQPATGSVLTPDFGLLTGTVYEPDGVTLADSTSLVLDGPDGHGEGKSLSDSKFYIGGLSPGKYKLTVTSFDYRAQVWDRNTIDSLDFDPILIGSGETEIPVIHQYFNNYDPVADLTAKWFEIFVAHVGTDIEIWEGTEVTLDATWSLDFDPGPLLYRYDVDGDGVWDTPYILDSRYEYTWVDAFDGTVSVEVYDGELTDVASIHVLVKNYEPLVEIGPDEHIFEGEEVIVQATLTERGLDNPINVVISWGDGVTEEYDETLLSVVETREYRHVYVDNGEMTLIITATDSENGVCVATKTVLVSNRFPVIDAGPDVSINLGELFAMDLQIQDPGISDTHLVHINWGIGIPHEEIIVDEPSTDFTVNLLHLYPAGDYTVTVTVTDDDDGLGVDQVKVRVIGLPPVANTGGPYVANEGDIVYIDASGSFDPDNEYLEYRWDFEGDGVWDTFWGPRSYVEKRWTDDFVGTIIVEVKDATASSLAFAEVTINNVAPIAHAGSEGVYPLGSTHYLGGGIIDPGWGDTVHIVLDWGDNSPLQTYDKAMSSGATSINDQHTYTEPGVYTLSIYVEDDDGASGFYTATITITEEPPVIQFDGPYNGIEGDTIIFDASGSYDPEGKPLEFRWDFENDGVWDTPWSLNAIAPMTYLDEYNGVVKIEVRDPYNQITGEAAVTIDNAAPILSAVSDITANEGFSTGFRVFYSDLGTLDTHTVTVDWGNGEINDAFVDITTGIIHTDYLYLDDGEYTVTVLVTDNSGASASINVLCHVLNGAPIVVAYSNYSPIDEGMSYRLDAELFEFGVEDVLTVTYDWGDGQIETLPLNIPRNFGQFSTTHLYVDDGVYTITVTVIDDDGAVGSASTEATVNNVAPIFDAGPGVEWNENENMFIHIPISDPGVNDLLQAHVNWGDGDQGMVSIGPNGGPYSIDESHTYADNGFYTVRITVMDMDGGSTVDMFTVVVPNVAPVISGGVDTTILVNTECQLDITVTEATPRDTHNIVIDWGDGQSESIMFTDLGPTFSFSAQHIYTSRGVYTVQLNVEDDDGGSTSSSHTVTVIGLPPVALAGGPYSGVEGESITLDASGSSDPDGAALSYRWDFDNDGIWDTELSTNPTVDHVWADEFVGEVSVEVEDDEFIASSVSSVNVVNVVPTIDIGGAVTLTRGETLELAGVISDPGIDDLLTGYVNWGDGPAEESLVISRTLTGGISTATHVYNVKGEYTVTVSITDGDSQSVEVFKPISVMSLPPAVIAGGPYFSEEGTPVTFDASGSTDPDLDALLFRWDLNGDGIFEIDWSSNPLVTYTWADEYSGNIILEVQDPDHTVTTSTSVEIMNLAPVIETGGDITTTEDTIVTLSGSVSDPGVNDVLSVEINWGDGDIEQVSPIGGAVDAQHVYADSGVYAIVATVDDGDGATATDTITVTVESAIVEGIHCIDAKPGAWPNKINLKSNGILQVAICGAYNFDVTDIDVETISLFIHGIEGPEPTKVSMRDVATPYLGPLGGGHNLTADGYVDLVIVYELEEIVSWYNLQDYAESDVVLRIESELVSGGSFEAEDILALSKFKAKTNQGKKK